MILVTICLCVCLCLALSYALPFMLLNFCQTSLESQSHDLASNYKLAGYWWLICVQLRRGGAGHDDIWQVRTLRRSISNIGTELTRHDTTRSHQPRFLFVSVGLLSISYLDHSLVILYISAETLHIFINLKLSTHPRRAVATHRTVLKLLMIQTLIFCKLPSRSPASIRRWRRVLLETPWFCAQLCFRISLQVKISIFEKN